MVENISVGTLVEQNMLLEVSQCLPARPPPTRAVCISGPSTAVKPTVVDVGIYVNSIGPVSSIDMHHSSRRTVGPPQLFPWHRTPGEDRCGRFVGVPRISSD
ncbi:unnamed protein product [Pleuronectes platessa]|uniref:Uncharacterized protein n=1 Tax=Pleuronectes platessa TaxID=8262 RepID=A0A9N7TQE2_PLEPL|nr:unnamed protein product [Pleuronectes platessa]